MKSNSFPGRTAGSRRFWFGPPRNHGAGADYRDRISVVTWVLVFGMGLSLLLEIPTTIVTFRALGSPISLLFSVGSLMALLVAVAAAAGTESIIRLHPRYAARRWGFLWAFGRCPWPFPSSRS